MAYDEDLADRAREVMPADAEVTERKMFGGLAFLLRGHMFAGIVGSELMVRIG
jgi:TfoX/Sxy family transcriptional regulator of competence genes